MPSEWRQGNRKGGSARGLHPVKKEPTITEKGSTPTTLAKLEESSSDSDDADYQPPSGTADSSSDSSSEVSASSDDAEAPGSQPGQEVTTTETSKPPA